MRFNLRPGIRWIQREKCSPTSVDSSNDLGQSRAVGYLLVDAPRFRFHSLRCKSSKSRNRVTDSLRLDQTGTDHRNEVSDNVPSLTHSCCSYTHWVQMTSKWEERTTLPPGGCKICCKSQAKSRVYRVRRFLDGSHAPNVHCSPQIVYEHLNDLWR